MRSHGWQVGLLSEMPPEGKVGVSAVCVLGYNVNQVGGRDVLHVRVWGGARVWDVVWMG